MAVPRQCWSLRDVTVVVTWKWCDVSTESCYTTGVGIYDQSRDVQPE
jgi:hypothetical protein